MDTRALPSITTLRRHSEVARERDTTRGATCDTHLRVPSARGHFKNDVLTFLGSSFYYDYLYVNLFLLVLELTVTCVCIEINVVSLYASVVSFLILLRETSFLDHFKLFILLQEAFELLSNFIFWNHYTGFH